MQADDEMGRSGRRLGGRPQQADADGNALAAAASVVAVDLERPCGPSFVLAPSFRPAEGGERYADTVRQSSTVKD
ncbi:hypothetical protein BRD56_06280 [Thermoplasmatales archaeon SW_10_69_26]|nr:MAG: hypothetical protein BRD56_06280 [Thermoplasmatales archaeon SW_10_69_26]